MEALYAVVPVAMSWLAAVLVALGVYGVLVSRNTIRILASIETMFNGIILALLVLIVFSIQSTPAPIIDASMLILFAIILTAVEVAVLAAILLLLFRTKKTVSTSEISDLRG